MLGILRVILIGSVALGVVLSLASTPADAVGPNRTCRWEIDGEQQYVVGEGTYECKCTVDKGCYWFLLTPDPTGIVNGREINMVVGVPEEFVSSVKEALFEVYVVRDAEVNVIEQQGVFPERVVIHRTSSSEDRSEIKVAVTVFGNAEFPTLVKITDRGREVVKTGRSNKAIRFKLD